MGPGNFGQSGGGSSVVVCGQAGVLCPTQSAFGATGNGVTDDTTALQLWLTALCATANLRGYVPTPSKCYKTTAQLTLNCRTEIDGADWNLTNAGNTYGTVPDPTTYVTGALFCPKQTHGTAFDITQSGGGGGDIQHIAFAGLGISDAAINIGASGISSVTNGGGSNAAGSLVTVNLPSHGLASGMTGLTIAGAVPSWTLSSCAEDANQPAGQQFATCTATAAHGMTLPQNNVWLTIAGVTGDTGYNGTKLSTSAVGPCTGTTSSCGVRGLWGDGVTNGTTTFTSATATFSAGDTGKAILIAGGLSGGGTLTTTITFVNSTTVTLASCGTGCSTGTGKVFEVFKPLLNTQFQYVTTGGLGAGTGGTVTQVCFIAGGACYNGTWPAQFLDANNLQFYLPFTGLGTLTSTGTGQLSTLGVSFGDASAGDYLTNFNSDHIGSFNFGVSFGFLEQNSFHNGLSMDRDLIGQAGEWNPNFALNANTFTGLNHYAAQAHMDIQFLPTGASNTWISPDTEDPKASDPTSVDIALADQLTSTIMDQYNENGAGTTYTGDGIDVLGTFVNEGTTIIGGHVAGTPTQTTDIHLFNGSEFHCENVKLYDNVIMEAGVIWPHFSDCAQGGTLTDLTALDVPVLPSSIGSSDLKADGVNYGHLMPVFNKTIKITGGGAISNADPTIPDVVLCKSGNCRDGIFFDGTQMKALNEILSCDVASGDCSFSASGTVNPVFSIFAPSGIAADLLDIFVGVQKTFSVTQTGAVVMQGADGVTTITRAASVSPAIALPATSGTLCVSGAPCAGAGSQPTNVHTLTGATPVAVVASATVPLIDVENLLLSINVTSYTLPAAAAVADGEILHVFIQQSTGSVFTIPVATVGPFTAGAGASVVGATGVSCPVTLPTNSATVPSELHAVVIYRAPLTEWVVESCSAVR